MKILGFLRSPIGIAVSVLFVIAVLGSALRRDVTKNANTNDSANKQEYAEDSSGNSKYKTSIKTTSSRSSGQGDTAPAGPGNGRKVGESREGLKETFDEELKRSKGNSWLTGRVIGMSGDSRGFGGPWDGGGGGMPPFGGFMGGGPGGSDRFGRSGNSQTSSTSSDRNTSNSRFSRRSADGQDRRRGTDGGNNRDRASNSGEANQFTVVQQQQEPQSREERMLSFMRDRGIEPVSKATVMLYENDPNTKNPPLQTTVTDEQGSFTLKQLNDSNRRYVLVVKADGYSAFAKYVTLNKEPGQEFVRLNKGVSLRGTVRDAGTSQSIAGAFVGYPAIGETTFGVLGGTTTSITGEFRFDAVPRGTVISSANAQGYKSANTKLRTPNNEAEIALVGGGSIIKGVTLDRLTNKPFQGAKVWVEGPNNIKSSVISKENGEFEVKDLPGGDYQVYAVRGLKSEIQNVELKDNETKSDVSIVVPSELLVTGKVVSAAGGQVLPGVKIWYEAPNGNRSVMSDSGGNFAFETMVVDKYKVQVHEKGYLPLQDSGTTGVVEVIERKVAKSASSDQFTIRLKPVAYVAGKVVQDGRGGWGGGNRGGGRNGNSGNNGGNGNNSNNSQGQNTANSTASETPGVANAEITVNYVMGRQFEQIKTTSDAAGYFFANMPERRRAQATIIARKNYSMGSKEVTIPSNKEPEIRLGMGNTMMGELLLTDESPLEGVKVAVSQEMKGRRLPKGAKLEISSSYTSFGGRLFLGLPDEQSVELTFSMPDGEKVSKSFQTSQLIRSSVMFMYDPVTKDVVVDIARRSRGGRGGDGRGNGGEGPGGNGQNGGRNNGNNNNGGGGGNRPQGPPATN